LELIIDTYQRGFVIGGIVRIVPRYLGLIIVATVTYEV